MVLSILYPLYAIYSSWVILLIINILKSSTRVTNWIQLAQGRGSIPAKVGFWVGLIMFSYVRTPTKLTNATSKTQLLAPKKGGFSPKIPRMWPFFCIWRVLAV